MSTSINRELSNNNDKDNCNVKKQLVYEQNKSSALALRFLVCFFEVHCTITMWNPPNVAFYERHECMRTIPPFFEPG